jgi:choline-phosphate cytidylyltransferase
LLDHEPSLGTQPKKVYSYEKALNYFWIETEYEEIGFSKMSLSVPNNNNNNNKASAVPKAGPEPVLLSRKEVDALYEILDAVVKALRELKVDYIVTGGSLLGAIRQHGILFCDDDIDIAIIDIDGAYDRVASQLQHVLGPQYIYQIRPWEGGDRVRGKRMNNVFLDLFALKRFESMDELKALIGVKKNGRPQSEAYVQGIVQTIQTCAVSHGETALLCPFWQFNTRKAIEMWSKEVYRHDELFPISRDLKFGPLTGIQGPRAPVCLLKRAFGNDCFEVYYQSSSHKSTTTNKAETTKHQTDISNNEALPPLMAAGGTWKGGQKAMLQDEHYLPMQPISRAARRPTLHNKERLFQYLEEQAEREDSWFGGGSTEESGDKEQSNVQRPKCTVYMDGVFDLFHIGHLEAIRQCAKLGNRVIIGVTGDVDATGYKRLPVVLESERTAIVRALREVDDVVCPCPLIVTQEFMQAKRIDLVVHGFADDEDAKRQEQFFAIPMQAGKFKRISYYRGLSTTEMLQRIRADAESEISGENGVNEVISKIKADQDSETPKERPEDSKPNKPQWFGAALAAATNNASSIPTDPFPLYLRQIIEPHIRKATKRREDSLGAIRIATGVSNYDATMQQFQHGLATEGDFYFDPLEYPLRKSFLQSTGLASDYDLTRLHQDPGAKDYALFRLTQQPSYLQEAYDDFVLNVCAPRMALVLDCDCIYYQAFPCLRMVQPDEFSIGPHADVAYGHHPCSVNFYLPLTEIGGSSALFLESRPGSEDWHPIKGEFGTFGGMIIHCVLMCR